MLCATTANHFLIRLWSAMKSGFYVTIINNQLSGWGEKTLQRTSQSQICTKKRSWTLLGGLLPVWSIITFWILEKPLHLRNMLCKWMRCIECGNTCRRHWSAERAWFFCIQCPATCHMTLQTLNELGSEVLTHLPYLPDHFFKHLDNLLQGKHFHNRQETENTFQEFIESWSMDFYTTGINQLISHWQKCVD